MSNSSLVNYTKLSPNNSGKRNHEIDTVSIHCYVGQVSVESMGEWLCKPSAQASANYGIGNDGRIGLFVEEANRSWCTSSSSNDNRAITIECASDKTDPYAVNDKVYASLIKLLVDICKRNGIKELKWQGDKKLIGQVDKQNMTVHRWFVNKACPGDYLYDLHGQIAKEVNALLGVSNDGSVGLQATGLKNLSEKEVVDKVGSLFTEDQKKNNVLAAVSMAQFILESGYGKTDLAQKANNCFGMKCALSGNSWSGSTWDGKSKYTKVTKEQDTSGKEYSVTADFRKYSCIEDSIGDHSAYLLGAMNGSKLRYDGLKGCTDYKEAIQIIKDGGYATDTKYVSKICSIIEKYDLTKFNYTEGTASKAVAWYRVRKTWLDEKSQKGAFENLDNAQKCADENPGYSVYNDDGKIIYTSETADKCPYKVRVDIDNLNIRTGAGFGYAVTGHMTGRGIFTIVEEKDGWGRLKSGAGWICLDFVDEV